MSRKIVWLVVSCVMVLGLLVTSCAPAPAKETTAPAVKEAAPAVKEAAPAVKEAAPAAGTNMVKLILTKRDGTKVEKVVEKPRYGGSFTWALTTAPIGFHEAMNYASQSPTRPLTNDSLFEGDIRLGQGGTGEVIWNWNMDPNLDTLVGCMAESWEMPDDNTIVFHIRKGVRWALDPANEASRLVNGREMDAYDVAAALNHLWDTPQSYHYRSYNRSTHLESIAATDKWTAVIKTKPGYAGRVFRFANFYSRISPREVIEKKLDVNDWKNSVGTGPFMLVDYVTQSMITFVRNPNYWMKDSRHPENQLPYVDGVKFVIIPDPSTRLSAMRTGKIDALYSALVWEETQQLQTSSPQIQWFKYPGGSSPTINMRLDMPELPWAPQNDPDALKVRRALMMAIDKQKIVDTYYGGQAILFAHPITPIPDFADMYVPLEQLSPSIQETFGYHPDKARQLLKEAGYPNGFKAEIMVSGSDTRNLDLMQVVKAYWKEIGVDLDIVVKEAAVATNIREKFTYPNMVPGSNTADAWLTFCSLQKDQGFNTARVNDPIIEEACKQVAANYFNPKVSHQVYKELAPYLLEQVVYIPMPLAYSYVPWQPWVKGYAGEQLMHANGGAGVFIKYLWIDQDLKYQMTGKR